MLRIGRRLLIRQNVARYATTPPDSAPEWTESIPQDSVGDVSVVDSIDTTSLNFIQESMLNVYRKGYFVHL